MQSGTLVEDVGELAEVKNAMLFVTYVIWWRGKGNQTKSAGVLLKTWLDTREIPESMADYLLDIWQHYKERKCKRIAS